MSITRFIYLPLFLILVFSCEKIEAQIVIADGDSDNGEDSIAIVDNGYDKPENEGVNNVILNASIITDCGYLTTSQFYTYAATYNIGETINGIIYSSTRYEDLFCPNNVSLWTYITSMIDPYSYQYTIDISLPPYSIQGLAKSYYGQVCTSFVQYALGIKYNFQIHQMTTWPEFDVIIPNDVNSLKLGDILTSEQKVHTRLVTGIKRQNGLVKAVVISEGTLPKASKVEYPVDSVNNMLEKEGYQIYRYKNISNVQYPPFPYDIVNTGTLNLKPSIMPKRGDRANWRKDEEVIVDILDVHIPSFYRVYKDGVLYQETEFPQDEREVNLGVLPVGDYRMVIIDNNIEKEPVYWMVVDYSADVKALGNGSVYVKFSSCNAIPVWITWRRPWSSGASNNDMPLLTTIIDDEARDKGGIVSSLDSYHVNKCGLGDWDFKVAFETKYGIISSDNVTVFVQ